MCLFVFTRFSGNGRNGTGCKGKARGYPGKVAGCLEFLANKPNGVWMGMKWWNGDEWQINVNGQICQTFHANLGVAAGAIITHQLHPATPFICPTKLQLFIVTAHCLHIFAYSQNGSKTVAAKFERFQPPNIMRSIAYAIHWSNWSE